MLLFLDCESNGLLLADVPRHDNRQPHAVQLAMLLTDNNFNEVGLFHSYIKPDGWSITDETTQHHGITTGMCETLGMPIKMALTVFSNFCYRADEIVIYNKGFDDELIKAEYVRAGREHYMYEEKVRCCMRPCTDVLKLPNPRGYSGYKWAKLEEAYAHFFGVEHENAHDAVADVRATAKVYAKLREGNYV